MAPILVPLPSFPESGSPDEFRQVSGKREQVILETLQEAVDCLNGMGTPFEAKRRVLAVVMALTPEVG